MKGTSVFLPIVIFPFFFIFTWLLAGAIVARMGGWRELARYYQDSSTFTGEWRRMQSARMRWGTNYNGCLNIGRNELGIRVETIKIFRLSHPPLFVPWSDIQTRPKQMLFFEGIEFRFARADRLSFTVGRKLGEWLLEAKRGKRS